MRDPVYAMKTYGGVNGDFSTTWCTRNCARPRSMSTATWLIPSIHNWVQMQAVSSPCTAPRFVGVALCSAWVWGCNGTSAFPLTFTTTGPRQLRQPQRQRRTPDQFLEKASRKLACRYQLTKVTVREIPRIKGCL